MEETHGLDAPPYEVWELCPVCRGTRVIEGFRCDLCGETITDRFAELDSGARYCGECCHTRELSDLDN